MNGLATLPSIPDSALDGLPPASDLPTPALRRRYAQAITAALLGEPSWQITLWPRWQVPRLLVLRAEREDWPTLGNAAVAAMLQPAPLPDQPEVYFRQAIGQMPTALQPELTALLTRLWAGEPAAADPGEPIALTPEGHHFLAHLAMQAGLRAAREADAAADAALAQGQR